MISRAKLYALGETFGESCTRKEAGRMIYGGGGGGSTSSSNATTTQNTDKRQVVDGGSVGVSSDSSTVNVSVTDTGAVKQAIDLTAGVGQGALDAYKTLLATTEHLVGTANNTIQASTDLAGSITSSTLGTDQTAKDAEKKKQYLIYGGVAIVVYLTMKKG